MNEDANPVVRIGAGKVQHFAGERPTFVTYEGITERQDGTRERCGHHMHRTTDAAVACMRKAIRRG